MKYNYLVLANYGPFTTKAPIILCNCFRRKDANDVVFKIKNHQNNILLLDAFESSWLIKHPAPTASFESGNSNKSYIDWLDAKALNATNYWKSLPKQNIPGFIESIIIHNNLNYRYINLAITRIKVYEGK